MIENHCMIELILDKAVTQLRAELSAMEPNLAFGILRQKLEYHM